jgi:hypothetical protein
MRFVGIDIGAERHSVAIVDDGGRVVSKSVSFEEGAAGYRRLGELLGSPADCLIAMEALVTIGKIYSYRLPRKAFKSSCSIRCARDASPKKNCSGQRLTKSMR